MTRFYCLDCEHWFDEPKEVPAWWFYEAEPFGYSSDIATCPYCGSDCIEERDDEEEEEEEDDEAED